jgi:predicted ester cyclase
MTDKSLEKLYRNYIECLNDRRLEDLGRFVDKAAVHNGQPLGLGGYRAMLEKDIRQIPDLLFQIELLIVDGPFVASRLRFDVTPGGNFLGLPVNGQKVSFTENVFYRFDEGKIVEVWSVIDKTAIEAQLRT